MIGHLAKRQNCDIVAGGNDTYNSEMNQMVYVIVEQECSVKSLLITMVQDS